ncbi:MAG: AsmA-like C-terminal region-containing protein, partial [Bacteroidota bacterium]
SLPAFQLALSVSNGKVKYPDLPLGVENVQAKIDVNSPSSDLDEMTVKVPQFHMDLGGNPVDLTLVLKRPMSDPDIQTSIEGHIDLDKVAKAFPVEGIETLNGQIDANLEIDTRMSYVELEAYDKVDMNGTLKVSNMNVQSGDYPAIQIQQLDTDFAPQFVDLKAFSAQLGKSDIRAFGRLDNLLAYFSPDLTMKGDLNLRGNLLDTNEWLPEELEETPTAEATTDPSAVNPGFDRFDFSLDAKIDKILYSDYVLEGTSATGSFSPSRVQLENFETKIEDSDLNVSGRLENVYAYLFDGSTINGQVDLYSSNLDLNQLYTAEAVETTESTDTPEELAEAIPVPGNIDMIINADLDKLEYDKLTFRDMNGQLIVKDAKVSLERFQANGLGGDFFLKGYYDTANPEKPAFNIKYDLSKLDVVKAVESLASIKTLAPIMGYVEGFLSSDLELSGVLNQDLSLDYSSLTGRGNLATANALIKNFLPLKKVGEQLNLEREFSDIKIEDTRNWFDIANGMLNLQEDDIQFNDMVVNVSGSHGLISQDMNYLLKFDIPKSKLTNNVVGQSADKGLGLLQGQASKLGLNINESENVKFNVKVTGNIADPKIKVNLVGVDGKTVKEEVVEAITDEVKDRLQGEISNTIQENTGLEMGNGSVESIVEESKEQAVEALEEKVEEAKENVAESVTETVKETVGEKIDSTLGNTAKDALKDVKEKIKLPFGNRKKNKDDNN